MTTQKTSTHKKHLGFIAILATTLLLGSVAYADHGKGHHGKDHHGKGHHGKGHHGRRGHGPGMLLKRALKSLDLSDTQRSEIKTIFKTAHQKMRSARGEIRAAHQEMVKALLGKTVNRSAAKAAQDKINALRARQANTRVEMFSDVATKLTPAQRGELRAKIKTHMKKRAQKMKARKAKKGKRGFKKDKSNKK